MEVISVEGFVVTSIPYKENSKILNILTPNYGIIGVISKGCKKLKSKLRNISERFAYGTFYMYYKENGLSILIDGDIKNYFENIKSDIVKISYLSYITELTTGVYKESNSIEVYNMFVNGILKLEEGLNPKVISNILEIQYLEYLGINLNLNECIKCGNQKGITISLSKGGYICSKCRTNEQIYNEKVIKMLRLYYYVDISKITEMNIDDNIINTIDDILNEYYDEYSGIHPKSRKFLKEINQ